MTHNQDSNKLEFTHVYLSILEATAANKKRPAYGQVFFIIR